MTCVTSVGPPGAGLEYGWRGRCRVGRGRESGTLILGKGACRAAGAILAVMKPAHRATRRFLPDSPFNNMPADPPVERFDVQDQVTHDRYGLGRVLAVENDDAVVVAFGSRNVQIMWPYAKLTKL